MNYTEQQLQDRFNQLPDDIKMIIADIETEDVIFALGQKHALHIDQLGQLADETGLVLLGLSRADDFVNHLQNRLRLDQPRATALATDINKEIFLPIREELKRLADNPPAEADSQAGETIFEQKMSRMFNLPREEGLIIMPSPPPHSGIPGIDTPKPKIDDPYLETLD